MRISEWYGENWLRDMALGSLGNPLDTQDAGTGVLGNKSKGRAGEMAQWGRCLASYQPQFHPEYCQR